MTDTTLDPLGIMGPTDSGENEYVPPQPAELIPEEVTTPPVYATPSEDDLSVAESDVPIDEDPDNRDQYEADVEDLRQMKLERARMANRWEQETTVVKSPVDARRTPQEGDWTSFSAWAQAGMESATQAAAGVDDLARNVWPTVAKVAKPLDMLAEWLNDNVKDLRYEPFQGAKTQQGEMIRTISRYAAAYSPVVRGLGAAGMTSKVGQSIVGSGFAELIAKLPTEERFADFLIDVGVPDNMVLNWLKTDETDGVALSAIKDFVDAAGAGALGEFVMKAGAAHKAIKTFIQKRRGIEPDAPRDAIDEALLVREAEAKEMEAAITKIGSANGHVIFRAQRSVIPGYKKAAATRALKEAGFDITDLKPIKLDDGSNIYVNWARVNTDEDVKQLMVNITEASAKLIDKAKGGKRSDKALREMAENLDMDAGKILNRQKGEVWNDAQVLAARAVWENAAENLFVAAERAKGSGTKADMFLMRKMQSVFTAINAEIRGASAESARSLRAWSLGTGDLNVRARMMGDMVEMYGGVESNRALAARLVQLHKQGLLKSKAGMKFLEKSTFAKGMDAFREAWVASLLWMPSTHIVNGASAMLVAMQQQGIRVIGSMVGAKGMHWEDSFEYAAFGMMAIKDAFRYAGKSLMGNEEQLWAGAHSKMDIGPPKQFVAEAFGASNDTAWGKTLNAVGTTFRVPLSVLAATDQFSKTILYRAELGRMAHRKAKAAGLVDAPGDPAYSKFMSETLSNPPKDMRIAAMDDALWLTFQDKGGMISQNMSAWRNSPNINAGGRFLLTMIFPFIKTPARILNYTAMHSPLAPLTRQWREDMASGDVVRQNMAKARLSVGTMSMATFADMADSGIITGNGPSDPAEREHWIAAGNQPYSMKVGDKWYGFNRADPIGMMMGVSADLAYIAHNYELGDADMNELEEIAAQSVIAVGNVLINKNYMQGLSKALNAISDPERYGKWWVTESAGTLLPAHTGLSNYTKTWVDDGTYRAINSINDAYKAKLLSMAKTLTPTRDIWGRAHKSGGAQGRGFVGKLFDYLSPVMVKEVKAEPVSQELVRLARSQYLEEGQGVPRRITKNTSFRGVQIDFGQNPKVYDDYVRMAGNDLKIPNAIPGHPPLGLLDALNLIVSGKAGYMSETYAEAPDAVQLNIINGYVQSFRDAASGYILENNPSFREYWELRKENQGLLIQGDEAAIPQD